MSGFDMILGNEQIKEHFEQAMASSHVSHCYILNGESGLGKMLFAKTFAQMLQCTGEGDKPCMQCHSCKQFLSGNHPDVIYVGHEKPNIIGVDDVRDRVVNDMAIKPYSSQYKIYIVDEAEKMSIQAQNALLKTMEEPPSYGIIMLLTTNAKSFLDTIRSRSVVLSLRPVSDEVMAQELHNQHIDDAMIPGLVKFARGNIGKALRLAHSERFAEMMEHLMQLLKKVKQMDFITLLDYVDRLIQYKVDISDCIDYMEMWYRDVLLYKATADMNLLIFREEYRSIKEMAAKSSYEGLEKIIKSFEVARRRLNANVNYELVMELMLLAIKEN